MTGSITSAYDIFINQTLSCVKTLIPMLRYCGITAGLYIRKYQYTKVILCPKLTRSLEETEM